MKEDIKHLHEKVYACFSHHAKIVISDEIYSIQLKTQYRFPEAYHMSQMRDLPLIAGAIIWARQIERQLQTYMKRVEDVLGKGWEHYAEGQKLQSESNAFRKKLDTYPVFQAWLQDISRRNMGVDGRLFEIVRSRGGGFSTSY